MRRWAIMLALFGLLLSLSQSQAQITVTGVGRGSNGGGTFVNACAGGGNTLDGTDAAGCNIIWFAH